MGRIRRYWGREIAENLCLGFGCQRKGEERYFAKVSGYTEKALRDKISTGVWVEGLHYYRAPDRHILINVKEVEKWQRNEYQPV